VATSGCTGQFYSGCLSGGQWFAHERVYLLEKQTMRCNEGHEMQERTGNAEFELADGVSITLKAARVFRCKECGVESPVVPAPAALVRVAAEEMAKASNRLGPKEIRFLRKSLGFSGKDYAAKINVDAGTVSRWERGAEPMGPANERLLRLMVLAGQAVGEYPLEKMATLEPRKTKLRAAHDTEGWCIEA
jgi:putative zinc finger/helix-turn-helix YgiT family protein